MAELTKRHPRLVSTGLAFGLAIAALAACNGGNGYAPGASANTAQRAVTPDGATTAWGKLVSDPDGKPLAGVPVALYPWKPCRIVKKNFECPAAILQTSTRPDGRFEFTAPNGRYLLAIGSDSGTDLKRPTVHDRVHLTGGMQHLLAPVLPTPSPVPNVKFYRVHLPSDQLHGLYRLTTIEANYEARCLRAFDAERQQHDLHALVADEWLIENERTLLQEYRHTSVEAPIQLARTAWHRGSGPCGSAAKADTDFGWLPPEINSARLYAGAGSGPMIAARTAWETLAADLGSLTNGPPDGDYPAWP